MPETPAEWTVLSMLEWGTSYFDDKQVPAARLSIEWLLAEVLDVRRLDLYLMHDRPLSAEELSDLRPLIKRRAQHEPLQYITGTTDFYSVTIRVEPGVLIPRPETEELVELAIHEVKGTSPGNILDVGTGSGCIAIALKKELPDWTLFAADISEKALTIAEANSEINNTEVHFLRADLHDVDKWRVDTSFDLLISNPPYIGYDEQSGLEKQVKDYEPEEALFCTDVTTVYTSLSRLGLQLLRPNGLLLAELNPIYSDEILRTFQDEGWEAEIREDLGGKMRFLLARKSRKSLISNFEI